VLDPRAQLVVSREVTDATRVEAPLTAYVPLLVVFQFPAILE
jgi:hypothetical protein